MVDKYIYNNKQVWQQQVHKYILNKQTNKQTIKTTTTKNNKTKQKLFKQSKDAYNLQMKTIIKKTHCRKKTNKTVIN